MTIASIGRTQAATAGFIPTIWAQKALDILRSNIVLAKTVARDYEYETHWKGETLNIPYPGTFTAQAKTEGTPATAQQPANAGMVAVTLTQNKIVDFVIEDFARAQTNVNLMDQYINSAMVALAEDLENYLFTFYTSFTGGTVGTSGTALARSSITAARELLNTNKAPTQDRYLILSTASEESILLDSTLQTYFAYARSQGITNGSIGMIDGFDIRMSQLVPVVAGTPNSTKCLAYHKDAVLLAVRPLPDAGDDPSVTCVVLSDPESGLSIRMQYQYRIDYRGMYIGFDMLYGGVALRPTLGVVALS